MTQEEIELRLERVEEKAEVNRVEIGKVRENLESLLERIGHFASVLKKHGQK